eukprot:COSAG06_NODE_55979_length_275_cov_0.542553_1_plen_36_part_10
MIIRTFLFEYHANLAIVPVATTKTVRSLDSVRLTPL